MSIKFVSLVDAETLVDMSSGSTTGSTDMMGRTLHQSN